MAFIFRLHPSGADTNTDWLPCLPYESKVISEIDSPNGATAQTEITSIPSPFARIALVKSAFGKVVKSKNLSGNTIYHKMVSDSLDVAEIFFNYDKYQGKFKILVWDVQNDISALKSTHPQIYDSLDVFLKQDAPVYHFDRMQRLYILVYVGGKSKTEMDVVGATSPASMFFTSANDLSYMSDDISFGQDHPFDGQFQPLYARDLEFVTYLFTFRVSYGREQFAADFPEVNAYLDATFEKLTFEQRGIIAKIVPSDINKFEPLCIDVANQVDILGKPIHKKTIRHAIQSDFTIAQSHYYAAGVLPLVLPVDRGNQYANLYYVQDYWGTQNQAPYKDNKTNLSERILPCDGTRHPYLTVDDFLEDTVLVYPRRANTDKFFFGNLEDTNEMSVFLPLKPLFFEFFTVNQLVEGVDVDGTMKPMLCMSKLNTGDISVTLTIPIQKGTVVYTKNYYRDAQPDANRNRGAVKLVDASFGLAMLPMVQTINPYYRIAIAHEFRDNKTYGIDCYLNGEHVTNIRETDRNKNDHSYLKTHIYSVDNDPIDCIRVHVGSHYGMVIPLLIGVTNHNVYRFAVDFGTTNTHIEYQILNVAAPTSFVDNQLTFWADYDARTEQVFEADLVPNNIGDRFAFPTRTALSESSDTVWNTPVIPMAKTNIPLVYGHRLTFNYNKITTDLKWSNDPDNIHRVNSYIENLMILMRNKVLQEGGDLVQTQIIWFYPSSMTVARHAAYEDAWNNAYQTYFGGPLNNICSTLESVAPYVYFRGTIPAAHRMVNIDIGGETTDVVIAQGGTVQYTTSFRFAANAIFGDGFTKGGLLNGMLAHYVSSIRQKLEDNGLNELLDVMNSLCVANNSTDLASFFFSIKNDDEVIKKGASDLLDWNLMLQQDDKFKVVFLLFYASIIYHVAHIMHAMNLQPPRHITFSGNGARVVTVLSPSNQILAEYTKDIFCRVYGIDSYDKNGLDIVLSKQPKVATCKGGLSILDAGAHTIGIGQKIVIRSTSHETVFDDPTNDTYASIDDNTKEESVKDIEEFLRFILRSGSSFSLKENFGIEQATIDDTYEECNRDLKTYLENGIDRKTTENAQTDPIEETLFFYPIIGMIHNLCAHIN